MLANIDGLKIHPVSTEKPLPILTSPKDENIPTTGNKIRHYFFIQNQYSLVPRTQNKPKAPPQKVDSDAWLGIPIFGSIFWDLHQKRNFDSVFDSKDSGGFFFEFRH